jgi:dTDP-4-amino-4,6-dideoxygalactose transaminase
VDIPFLRPRLVPLDSYAPLLRQIDASRLYSNSGPLNTRFEREVVERLFDGVGQSVTVCNATLGLMLAIRAVKRAGRFAVMPSFTFAATPLAAQWCGLEPYFVDVDPETWCLDGNKLQAALDELGDQVAVVVPYAAFGTAMDCAPYERLQRIGWPVVIDAAPGLGTRNNGQAFGLGFSGAIVYSLHATKTFGIGEGGLVYSGDSGLITTIRRLANFGFDASRSSSAQGLNAKLSEYAAAIALATLQSHAERVAIREELYQAYVAGFRREELIARGWRLQQLAGEVAHQFMPACTPCGTLNRTVVDALAGAFIEIRTYFAPACHQQAQFSSAPCGPLAVTEDLSRRIVSLPLWEDMGTGRVNRVCAGLRAIPVGTMGRDLHESR